MQTDFLISVIDLFFLLHEKGRGLYKAEGEDERAQLWNRDETESPERVRQSVKFFFKIIFIAKIFNLLLGRCFLFLGRGGGQ